ncbi:predicted protein [Nematostella vectensis]|uniref:G-protein coupled receptors family 1 profile domain-containing protein n=1 Tax=Nematostella vectensis TaxID=45351 RepID=A7SB18_NEMVE|nr:octopamine receptor beta-2R [Nematostella vectensis]EDO39083.1 predicted protein [Nematostella vectensis]|eukprot:XP_001631146.1 predicted protein [Nematostella vectensis]
MSTADLAIRIPLATIGTIITVENLFVCYIVYRFRNLRTFTNGFVVSLAFSDALVGGILLPLELARYTSPPGVATAEGYFISIILQANVFNLLAVTFDRYLAVMKPLTYIQFMDKHFVKLPLLAWIVPVVISLIPLTWKTDISSTTHRVYLICILILGIVLPYCLILFAYVRIFREVARLVKSLAAMQHGLIDGRMAEERGRVSSEARVTRIFAVIFAIFFVAWMPVIYMTIAEAINKLEIIPSSLMTISWFTLVIGSSMNAPIYAYFKADFRRTIIRMIRGRKKSRATWKPEDCSSMR